MHCLWCHNPEAMRAVPEVALDSRRCRACGACAEACPHHAHEFQEEVHLFHGGRCEMALACVAACREGALRVIGRETTLEALLPELRDAPSSAAPAVV